MQKRYRVRPKNGRYVIVQEIVWDNGAVVTKDTRMYFDKLEDALEKMDELNEADI